MPQAELIVTGGRLQGQRFPVAEGVVLTLGRSLKSDIQLPDKGVSRLHCRIENKNGVLRLYDLGSSNGTRVNDELVDEQVLNNGDGVAIGSSEMTVCLFESSAEEKPPTRSPGKSTVRLVQDEDGKDTAVRRTFNRDTATLAPDAADSPALAEARKRLAAVCAMANTIYDKTSLRDILDTAVDTILEVSAADRSAIVMCNDATGALMPTAVRCRGTQVEERPFPVSRTIVEETLRTGVSVISSDAAQDERFKLGASVVVQNIHSVMCAPLRSEHAIIGAIYVDSSSIGCLFTETELALLAAIGQQAGVAIERARLIQDLENLFVGAMHTLIATIEAKDPYTRGHSERVTQCALLIGDELGIDEAVRSVLEIGGVLHDVGKIGVPEAVLLKPGRLTDDEYEVIKKHPGDGAAIIENMPEVDRIVDMSAMVAAVRHHHERFDGRGYPEGLAGEAIPLAARILAVADTYDAITSDRPYRKGRSAEDAANVIHECAGTQFDPAVAEAFMKMHARGVLAETKTVQGRFQIAAAHGTEKQANTSSEQDVKGSVS